MNTQVSYIQPGWSVRSADGQDLGTVIDLSPDTLYVRADDGRRHTISKAVVEEEDEGAMLAILSIEAATIDESGAAG